MSKYDQVEIRKIDKSYARELSTLLQNSDFDYSQYFIPFSFDFETVSSLLSSAVNDHYFGVFIDNRLVGYYMLRGFDQGYEVPSYGVWIAKEYSGLGLGRLTIYHAISFCKINKTKKLMLKVHPENKNAKKIYEQAGFKEKEIDSKIGHIVYIKDL